MGVLFFRLARDSISLSSLKVFSGYIRPVGYLEN